MAKYISNRNHATVASLKRRAHGTVVRHHCGGEDIRFTRIAGGWRREREDVTGLCAEVVSSSAVARECNCAYGCRESWARVY